MDSEKADMVLGDVMLGRRNYKREGAEEVGSLVTNFGYVR